MGDVRSPFDAVLSDARPGSAGRPNPSADSRRKNERHGPRRTNQARRLPAAAAVNAPLLEAEFAGAPASEREPEPERAGLPLRALVYFFVVAVLTLGAVAPFLH